MLRVSSLKFMEIRSIQKWYVDAGLLKLQKPQLIHV